MSSKFNKDGYGESSRKTRVKLHKSGKHWVRTVMSQIGLIRLIRGGSVEKTVKVDDLSLDNISATTILKGAAALGAIAGGVSLTDDVYAEEVVIATETTTSTVVGADEVALTSPSATVDEAADKAAEEQEQQSEKDSESLSQSTSESASTFASESVSESISESVSESLSESVSDSQSESASASESLSESTSGSLSESVSASELTSSSATSESDVSKETEATVIPKADEKTEKNASMAEIPVTKESAVANLTVAINNLKQTLNTAESLEMSDLVAAYALLLQAQGVISSSDPSLEQLNLMQSVIVATDSAVQKRVSEKVMASGTRTGDYITTSNGLTYAETTASDGSKRIRLTSIMPHSAEHGKTFEELGLMGRGFRATVNGTKITLEFKDLSKGISSWGYFLNNNISQLISNLRGVYDTVTKTITWTADYDNSFLRNGNATAKKNYNPGYIGAYIGTSGGLGTPTNITINGARTSAGRSSTVSGVTGTQYYTTGTQSLGTHRISFTTSYTGSLSELSNIRLRLFANTASNQSYPSGYEDGRQANGHRPSGSKYIVSNGHGTAVSGYYVQGVNRDVAESLSASESRSISASDSMKESVSQSQSKSISASQSVSNSQSLSTSASKSASISKSVSDSQSLS
uniref:accessory Sec-dependent serine-rich glycoprotein adhesin n=1 Tax=Streptococcus acidominimus TaxID=1326 RepID=UPI001F57182C